MALQVRIVRGEHQRGLILTERAGRVAATPVDLGEAANGRQILGRTGNDAFEFELGFVEAVEGDKGAPEREPGGDIARMAAETGRAHLDGLAERARPPVLFGELRKRNRRRVLANPASKIF